MPRSDSFARTAGSCQKLERGEGGFSPPRAVIESMVLTAPSFPTLGPRAIREENLDYFRPPNPQHFVTTRKECSCRASRSPGIELAPVTRLGFQASDRHSRRGLLSVDLLEGLGHPNLFSTL